MNVAFQHLGLTIDETRKSLAGIANKVNEFPHVEIYAPWDGKEFAWQRVRAVGIGYEPGSYVDENGLTRQTVTKGLFYEQESGFGFMPQLPGMEYRLPE